MSEITPTQNSDQFQVEEASSHVPSTPSPTEQVKKKRGRPRKGIVAPSADVKKRKNFNWTLEMENKLLELRYSSYQKEFCDAKQKTQVGALWNKIVMELGCLFHIPITKEQASNKIQQLKASYRSVRAELDTRTGNVTENPIELPANWELVNQYFKAHTGAGGEDLGQSSTSIQSISFDDDQDVSSDVECVSARKKPRGGDLPQSVFAMADAIKVGFLAIANKDKAAPAPAESQVMAEMKDLLQSQQAINIQLLQALKDLKK